MSYLSTLAARALEHPQPIRPRLASLFEPLAGLRVNFRETTANPSEAQQKPRHDTNQNTITLTPREVASSARNQTEDRAPDQSPSKQIDHGRARTGSFSQPVQTPTETRKLEQGRAADISAVENSGAVVAAAQSNKRDSDTNDSVFRPSQTAEPAIQITQAIKVEETTLIEQVAEASPQSLFPEIKLFHPDAPRPSVIVKPEVSTDHSQSQRIEAQLAAPEMPPSVRITIGRVDVRAIMPPAQSTVTVAPQPAMKALTLDEYLKQRNGEQR